MQIFDPCTFTITVAFTPFCSSRVLLVSSPSLPQLGTILPTSQATPPASQPVSSQHAARIVSHLAAGSIPQVRVVSAQTGLGSPAGSQPATMVHQTPHQIRMPVSVSAKGIPQVTKTVINVSQVSVSFVNCTCISVFLCINAGSGICAFEESSW